jgi:hypothetical protein
MASRAVTAGSASRTTSLKTSSESGPAYPAASVAATTPVTSSVPSPGKHRKCRLHSSTFMSSSGASATWRNPIREPGIPARAAPVSPRASMWNVSTARVTAGWSARTTASQACPTRLR